MRNVKGKLMKTKYFFSKWSVKNQYHWNTLNYSYFVKKGREHKNCVLSFIREHGHPKRLTH